MTAHNESAPRMDTIHRLMPPSVSVSHSMTGVPPTKALMPCLKLSQTCLSVLNFTRFGTTLDRQEFSLLLKLAKERPEVFERILSHVEDPVPLRQTCRLVRAVCLECANRSSTDASNRILPRRLTASLPLLQDQLERFVFEEQFQSDHLKPFTGRMLVRDESRAFLTCEHFPGESDLIHVLRDDAVYWLSPEWTLHRKAFLRHCKGSNLATVKALCCSLKIALRPAFSLGHDRHRLIYPMEAWWAIERKGKNVYTDRCLVGVIVHKESRVYKEAKRQSASVSRSFVLIYVSRRFVRLRGLGNPAELRNRGSIPDSIANRLVWISKEQLTRQKTVEDTPCLMMQCILRS